MGRGSLRRQIEGRGGGPSHGRIIHPGKHRAFAGADVERELGVCVGAADPIGALDAYSYSRADKSTTVGRGV